MGGLVILPVTLNLFLSVHKIKNIVFCSHFPISGTQPQIVPQISSLYLIFCLQNVSGPHLL